MKHCKSELTTTTFPALNSQFREIGSISLPFFLPESVLPGLQDLWDSCNSCTQTGVMGKQKLLGGPDMVTVKYWMVIAGRLFVKVTALRLQFDPGSRDAAGHHHSHTMLVFPALWAPVLMIGEGFTNRITKHKTLVGVSGECSGGVKMLLYAFVSVDTLQLLLWSWTYWLNN